MDKDRVKGTEKKVAGSAKEGVGKLTGDKKVQAQGATERATGNVQNAAGKAKDAARNALKK